MSSPHFPPGPGARGGGVNQINITALSVVKLKKKEEKRENGERKKNKKKNEKKTRCESRVCAW